LIDLIELLYRQHKQLRHVAETMWNENSELHLTSSEWYVLKNISVGRSTVPELMMQLDISKQGVHKFLISLEEKQLITTELVRGKKVQKKANLTAQGMDVLATSKQMEQDVEKMVRQTIGDERYNQLLAILQDPLVKY
jgi:DNA-binding MarR family transcriptional regulator